MALNEEQAKFVAAVMAARGNGMRNHIACGGGGGTGKTKVTKHLIEAVRGSVHDGRPDVSTFVLSPTNRGVALYRTSNIQGVVVKTNDSFLKTGGKQVSDIPWGFRKLLAAGWGCEHFGPASHTGCGVFIVDEAWAMSAEMANLLLRAAEALFPPSNPARFMFVLVGDPLQLPPVEGGSFWLSRFWCPGRGDRATVLKMLTQNMRQDKDAWFARAAASMRLPAGHRRPGDELLYEHSMRRHKRLPVGSSMTLAYTNKQCCDVNAEALRDAEAAGRDMIFVLDKGKQVQTFYADGPVVVVGRGTIPATGPDGDTVLPNGTLARIVKSQDAKIDRGGWVDVRVPSMGGQIFRMVAEKGGLPLEQGDALTVHKLQGETLVDRTQGGIDRLIIDCSRLPKDPTEAVALLYVGLTRAGATMGPDSVEVRHYAPGSIYSAGKPITKDDKRVHAALQYFRAQELTSTRRARDAAKRHAGNTDLNSHPKRGRTHTPARARDNV